MLEQSLHLLKLEKIGSGHDTKATRLITPIRWFELQSKGRIVDVGSSEFLKLLRATIVDKCQTIKGSLNLRRIF